MVVYAEGGKGEEDSDAGKMWVQVEMEVGNSGAIHYVILEMRGAVGAVVIKTTDEGPELAYVAPRECAMMTSRVILMILSNAISLQHALTHQYYFQSTLRP